MNRGCVPTKTLMHTANLFGELQGVAQLGLDIKEAGYRWDGLHQRKNQVVEQLRAGIAQLLQANGVAVYNGMGTILDGHTVQTGGRCADCPPYFDCCRLSTGDTARQGADLPGVVTSDALLEQNGVDCQRLLIIGGGVIGTEMASVYAALDKQVTIVEAAERILPTMDREISQNMSMILKKRGVEIYTSALVSEISQQEDGLCCHFTAKKEEKLQRPIPFY